MFIEELIGMGVYQQLSIDLDMLTRFYSSTVYNLSIESSIITCIQYYKLNTEREFDLFIVIIEQKRMKRREVVLQCMVTITTETEYTNKMH